MLAWKLRERSQVLRAPARAGLAIHEVAWAHDVAIRTTGALWVHSPRLRRSSTAGGTATSMSVPEGIPYEDIVHCAGYIVISWPDQQHKHVVDVFVFVRREKLSGTRQTAEGVSLP